MGQNGTQGDGRSLFQGIAIDARAERGEGDALHLILLSQVEEGLVGAGEQARFFSMVAVDGADGMEDVFCLEPPSCGCDSAPGGATADLATLLHNARPTRVVDRAIDASTTSESLVRCIYDCI